MIEPSYPQYFHTESGIRIFYTTNFSPNKIKDDDLVIVFNYGLVCNVEHYRHQITYFHKMGFKIIFHDYRFHYSSSSTQNIKDCNFNEIVSDIKELLNHLNVKKTIQIGHSMGVNITLEFAYQYPNIISGMILISGTVLPPQDIMFDTNLSEIVLNLLSYLVSSFPEISTSLWKTQFMNPLARSIVYKGGFNTAKTPKEFVHLYMKKLGELSPEIFLQLLDEMKNHDILQRLEKIQTKSLIIGGDKDQVIPNFLQKILYRYLNNSELYIVKDGSHVPQTDFPDNINERIEIFIKNFNA